MNNENHVAGFACSGITHGCIDFQNESPLVSMNPGKFSLSSSYGVRYIPGPGIELVLCQSSRAQRFDI